MKAHVKMEIEFKTDLGSVDGVSDADHAAIGIALDILSSDDHSPYIRSIKYNNLSFEAFDPNDPLNWSV